MTKSRITLGIAGLALTVFALTAVMSTQAWAWLAVLLVGVALLWVALFGEKGGVGAASQGIAVVTGWLREVIRRPLARWGGWDGYDPSLDSRPWWLEPGREVGVALPGQEDAGELGLWDDTRALTAVLEITGHGDGLLDPAVHARVERDLTGILRALARPGMPVSQLDLITRVTPAHAREHRDWLDARTTPGLTAAVTESMGQLAVEAERLAETVRSFAVIRMPVTELHRVAADAGEQIGPDTAYEQALFTTGQVARLLRDHHIPVLRSLATSEKAALIRSLLVPSYQPGDTSDLGDSFWDAWPRFTPSDRGRALETVGRAGDRWWHATATIPIDGWPEAPVYGRWAEPLVFGTGLFWRTVVTSYRLLTPRDAGALARDQLTNAASRRHRERATGEAATGQADQAMSLAQVVTTDVVASGHAGVIPATRVLISAPSLPQLERFREETERITTQDMSCQGLTWDDHQHTVGVLHCLPLGLEVQR